jgi:hypothetical protein
VTPLDERFAQVLRKSGKQVHLIANKAEGKAADAGLMEAYSLGFDEPVPLSAEHGLGLAQYKAGDLDKAMASFEAIVADPLASRDAQSRVQLFIQQLLSEGAAPVVTSSEVAADVSSEAPASSEAPVSSSAEVSSSAQ